MKTILYIIIATLFIVAACQKNEPSSTTLNFDNTGNQNEDNKDWLIPIAEVRDGGPGKDGIPALSDINFINVEETTYLLDNDLVLGFADGEDVRAYPHPILDWHEIINDDTENHSLAVIYCPLTGTGIGWDRVINEQITTFGVSGLLYNSNIIPYDRLSDSNWSQLLLKSVNGELAGTIPKTYNLIETTWKTWKEMFPSTKVVSRSTGYNRSYLSYPYGDYKTSKNLIFPVSNLDNRRHEKERVLAVIINEKAAAFTFENATTTFKLVNHIFEETKLAVVKNTNANLILAFNRVLTDGTLLNFEVIQNELPTILLDEEGTKWDVFGRGISGPRKGQNLEPIQQMMGYWFSFATFYPEITLY
ncbi:MAG: DUF3179 domain-containing protein [Prolixibacteraceae bacterium]|jgi:hypothetical protein|nr:DUF3179 domain-containing protein [Prolixibacteraceae bacterium]MBT6004642.1 DUF3179 domain-containing protein [Prolixibacteraceae bacterium]MBT6763469.1 DUF3179 domain-containing protein [Prolixibacteraceae bacterium]MBT6996882.1 DUF3179 domain-containing protein [Prolixibacteraceae bacterium]